MLSSMPVGSVLQPPPIPTFVLIPTSNGVDRTTNGNHIEMTGRNNLTPEIKPNNGQQDSDQGLSNDEESILYRSMTISDNQSHY